MSRRPLVASHQRISGDLFLMIFRLLKFLHLQMMTILLILMACLCPLRSTASQSLWFMKYQILLMTSLDLSSVPCLQERFIVQEVQQLQETTSLLAMSMLNMDSVAEDDRNRIGWVSGEDTEGEGNTIVSFEQMMMEIAHIH